MFPLQDEFPKFVPDQLLTSDDLNNLFDYLEEQDRLTRSNLIGIGILCGFQVKVNAEKTEITITKGLGVTSQGYLVTADTTAYSQYKEYDVKTAKAYDKFNNPDLSGRKFKKIDLKNSKAERKISKAELSLKNPMKIWELKQSAEEEGLPSIDSGFLNNKLILLFVELLETDRKNCNPNSCDDKGITVTVSVLPMAVEIKNPEILFGKYEGRTRLNTSSLPELKLKRWDVLNSNPTSTEAIFTSFINILDKNFINEVEEKLSNVYSGLGYLFDEEYKKDPFEGFATRLGFLHNNSLTLSQLIHIQYYYDFFSDILSAYEEFRSSGNRILSVCLPDADLFPRHLILGKINDGSVTTEYRHFFMYSPLLDQREIISELKVLFRKLVLLTRNIPFQEKIQLFEKIIFLPRITPSSFGKDSLSEKAIPFYYHVKEKTDPLLNNWSYRRVISDTSDKILSYYASDYNTSDEFVADPLSFDLEPYNFFRIEGHIGLPVKRVVAEILRIKRNYRLSFDIVALKTISDEDSSAAISGFYQTENLELFYDFIKREWLNLAGATIEYFKTFSKGELNSRIKLENKFGSALKKLIKELIDSEAYLEGNLLHFISGYDPFISIYKSITEDAENLRTYLIGELNSMNEKSMPLMAYWPVEDLIDHLDELIMICQKEAFQTLNGAFKNRDKILSELSFSSYAQKHPGLQHKAGVTPGGTFILVYHKKNEAQKEIKAVSAKTISAKTKQANMDIRYIIDELVLIRDSGATADTLYNRYMEMKPQPVMKPSYLEKLIDGLDDGLVIADFYLPYTCCSDKTPIQFVLRADTPVPSDDTTKPLTLTLNKYVCEGVNQYWAEITISGGTPPYNTTQGEINGGMCKSKFYESGEQVVFTVSDTAKNVATINLYYDCQKKG
jgi:hypothetical protein